MSQHTRSQFCKLLDISQATISMAVKRGHLIMSGDYIDDTLPQNSLFVQKKMAKMDKAIAAIPEADDVLSSGPNDLAKLNSIKTKVWIKKTNEEYEIAKIKKEKLQGALMPSELVKPVFLHHNQSIVAEFKNAIDDIVRIFAQKKSLSVNEKAEMTGELINCINQAISKATKLSIKNINNIIEEFTEKKGVGERL